MPKSDAEHRDFRSFELRAQGEDKPEEMRVQGYATTFNDAYELWQDSDGTRFMEIVDRHALEGADMTDVIMQYDHHGSVMARISNGTLALSQDEHGFAVDADLSKSAAARNLYEEIRNGLITKMSWAFVVDKDSVEHDAAKKTYTRRILHVRKVYDVSAVSIPANGDTNIAARSAFDGAIEAERRSEREKQRMRMKLKLEGIA